MKTSWAQGDWAVYRKSKVSKSPGPRAQSVVASEKGDSYTYIVDKFWVVEEVLPDRQLKMRTAGGKSRIVPEQDPSLRRPTLAQRLLWRSRFRSAEEIIESANGNS